MLDDVSFSIGRGEKLAFVGKNGEGKTTMARIILDELEHEGEIQLGHQVKIGYFAQNQADKLDEKLTVLESVDRLAVGEIRTKIRDLLGAFLFGGEAVDKKVAVLSGGERTRLALVMLLLEPVNFLIMDEPTNHLDIRSKELLKNALAAFEGTVLVVSHDRDFLDGLITKTFEFSGKKIKEHIGGIYEFLAAKKLDSLKELELKPVKSAKVADPANEDKTNDSEGKVRHAERRELNRRIKKLSTEIQSLEQLIEKLETQLSEMDALLAGPEPGQDMSPVYESYEKINAELTEAMENWEALHNQLNELSLELDT